MRIAILGNCVAERLQNALAKKLEGYGNFEVLKLPPVHLCAAEKVQNLSNLALTSNIIFTQPLLNFGPCNTDSIRKRITPSQRLHVFSSPNFPAYFPDAVDLALPLKRKFEPVLDWHSSIILSCFAKDVNVFEVAQIYENHSMFSGERVRESVSRSLESLRIREQGVDFSVGNFIRDKFTQTKLFHSPRHPADEMLSLLLRQFLDCLGLEADEPLPVESFSFNQWPVITGSQNIFTFPEQKYFLVGGSRFSIEDIAMAYYNFYEFHPETLEMNRDKIIGI